MSTSAHLYDRPRLDPEGSDSLACIARRIAPASRVLDLGCGPGLLGRYLAECKQCQVDGVELYAPAAELARSYLRMVWNKDLQGSLDFLENAEYDVIVCADVLEHLVDPAHLLRQLPRLLSPAGQILISVPNIAHQGVLLELMAGDFRYGLEGLLDSTHLRFFTGRSFLRLLDENGLQGTIVDRVIVDVQETEFRDRLPEAASRPLLDEMMDWPEASTYQYIMRAVPQQGRGIAVDDTPWMHPARGPGFTVKVYGRSLGASFSEERCSRLRLPLGVSKQTIRIPLPPGSLDQIRLDMADRVGFMRVFDIRLVQDDRQPAWIWDGRPESLCHTLHGIFPARMEGEGGLILALLHDDPWWILPVDGETLSGANALELTLSWPRSADYVAVEAAWEETLKANQEQQRQLQGQAEENLAQRLTMEKLKGSLAEAERTLEGILHSHSWRLTAPLRRAVQKVKTLRALAQRARAKRGYLNSRVLRRSAVYLFTGRWRTLIQKARRHWLDDEAGDPVQHIALSYALHWLLPNTGVAAERALPVDIIIPVYNGMEFLEEFFDRLLLGTPAPYRLIIVDDASPDPRVYPFLENMVQRLPAGTAILLRNAKNLGFVGTVNRALGISQHDVVLLNTDVLLPPDWLGRLMAPINEDARVASVTPFTNAGTICSFPQCCVDNAPFMALDVADIDRAFRRVNPTIHAIDLPTGVGFCMALSRRAINEVGVLDEQAFGKGYGEENDWCMRATRRSYRHRIAPNLYVYHRHGGSFAPEEKKALLDRNLRLLEARYPEYPALVERFIHEDPLRPIRQVMAVLLAAEHAAKTMLIIDHDRGGGANHYRDTLVDQWLREHTLVLLFVEDYLNRKCTLKCCYGDDRWSFTVPDLNAIKDLSEEIDITEIWYNSTVFSSNPMASIQLVTELKRNSNASLIITIHDYYPLCPSYTLVDHQGRFCGLPDPAVCRRCLPHNRLVFPNAIDDIDRWRDVWGACLGLSDSILCFSESSKLLVERIYPLVADRIQVRPHALDYFPSRKPHWDPQNGIHIGVIGALSFQKGVGVVQNIARLIEKEDRDLSLTIIGYADEAFPLPNHVPVTGPFDSQELPRIIEQNNINFILFPSICPETFSYVTSEVIAMGLPIACFDYGAQAEKVRPYDLGLVLDSSEPKMIVDEIRQFCKRLRNNGKVMSL